MAWMTDLADENGSISDSSGRIRQGPAPFNLAVLLHAFTATTTIKIG